MKKKITNGFVVQTFDDEGNFLDQEFVASDNSDYEDEMGNPIDADDSLYHPFEMEQ